jgi:hypothetical protein
LDGVFWKFILGRITQEEYDREIGELKQKQKNKIKIVKERKSYYRVIDKKKWRENCLYSKKLTNQT